MGTSVTTAAHPAATHKSLIKALVAWIKGHKQAAGYGVAVLALAAGLFVWNLLSTRSAELNAGRQVEQGRLALSSGNYALAASVLSRVVENYAGTRAAEEGSMLLAQVRLAQGHTQQAIDLLKQFAPKADRNYRAQAYGLLGAAYENAGHPREAAEAYQRAAEAAPFPFLRAQFLSDAGRAWLAAGDTTQAVAAYRTIVEHLDSTSVATEVKVRLGELTKGAVAVPAAK
jgi:tetratricopeptide (TPR) repeat protein